MNNSLAELKAVSEAARNAAVFDPDMIEFPHQFVARTYTDDETGSDEDKPQPRSHTSKRKVRRPKATDEESSFSINDIINIVPLSGTYKTIPEESLTAAGWNRKKGADKITLIQPKTWVDLETGEILTQNQLRDCGMQFGSSKSERTIKTQAILGRCPPKKQDFAYYILKLRNKRGGLVVDLKTALDYWIAYEHPKIDSTDKSRKRRSLEKFLEERGIMANNQSLSKDLQFLGNPTKTEILEEPSRLILALPVKAKPGRGIWNTNDAPFWSVQ
ncbi:hypothetical protein PO002_20500 [Cupriavidus necator]|uniref:hypothetical protein n=1 Tax=Cupriavidus necator TaxID=106590 RepID=UPI0039C35E2E